MLLKHHLKAFKAFCNELVAAKKETTTEELINLFYQHGHHFLEHADLEKLSVREVEEALRKNNTFGSNFGKNYQYKAGASAGWGRAELGRWIRIKETKAPPIQRPVPETFTLRFRLTFKPKAKKPPNV